MLVSLKSEVQHTFNIPLRCVHEKRRSVACQIIAISDLESSHKANKPRDLILMATGSGKTFASISFIYRFIKFAGARRVLLLVTTTSNLARNTSSSTCRAPRRASPSSHCLACKTTG